MKYGIVPLFILLCVFNLFSQETNIQKKESYLDISFKEDVLYIQERNYIVMEFLDNITLHAQDNVYFSEMTPIISFDAFTKVPTKKNKFKKTSVKVIENKDIVDSGIFYGGHKKKEFVYPGVVPHSLGVLDYTLHIKDPHLITPFYFDDRYPVDEAKFSVRFPSEVEIDFNLFNMEHLNVDYVEKKEDGATKYSWTIRKIKKRIYNSSAPTAPYFAPHILIRIKSYKEKDKIIKVAENTDDLFNWYNSLIHKIPDSDLSKIKTKVKELTTSSTTDLDKIKTIYQWVQSNIRYVAFEDGMAGFIPRASGDIYAKKYGDCKDMANLLTTMLKEANVPAFLTWVGTNHKPYSYHDVPCTITDNHMICAVKEGEEFIFLDPTNSYLKYGTSPVSLQGKEALVRIDDTNYEIIKISETDFSFNSRKDQLDLELQVNELVGEVFSIISGYHKENYHYSQLSKEFNNETNFMQNYLQIGKNSSIYKDPKIKENEQNVNLSFNGIFKNEVLQAGEKIYINLNLDTSSKSFRIEDLDSRVLPVQEDFKHIYTFECALKIPEGYQVEFLPENIEINHSLFNLKTEYKQNGNELIYLKTILSNYLFLEPKDFDSYKDFYSNILKINQQKLTLHKK